MRLVKVGLASVNTTVGAFSHNVDKALVQARKMAADDVTLGLFQEQVIGGYPAEDLIQWQGFIEHQWPQLERFAKETAALPTVFVLGVAVIHQGLRFNCAAIVAGGKVLGLVPKEKLPTYSIFYEARTWSRGYPGMAEVHRGVPLGDYLFRFDFGVVAPEVCEDVWSPDGPQRRRTYSGGELVVNLSASPFRLGFVDTRRELLATRAADHQCTLAYANALGCNDGIIFDGGGFLNQNGRPCWRRPASRRALARRWWTWTAPCACAPRPPRGAATRRRGCAREAPRCRWWTARAPSPAAASACATPCPRTAASSSPARRSAARPARPCARTSSTRSRWAWATTSRRRAPSS
jgi:NAD+ synthase (glutamine-hydrolysing)